LQILFCSNDGLIPLENSSCTATDQREEPALPAKKRRTDQALKKEQKQEEPLTQRLIKGMGHPLRIRILALTNERPWSPREIQQELGEGLSQVSYHVKVLNDLKMIELVSTEPRRGAVEHYYSAVERAFIPSSLTKDIPKSAQQILGDDTLEKIDDDLRASLKSGRFYARDDWHVSWTPVDLDGQGCKDAEKLADRFAEDILAIEAESAQRRANSHEDEEHLPVSAVALVFGSERAETQKAPSRKPTDKKNQSGK
jgi:DNA-binding transcriptional ArsR family regulator